MCFPYPFLIDQVDVRRSKKSIRVVLKKACREPWPCHFTEKSKWKVDNLAKWKEQSQLELVLPGSQFTFHIMSQTDSCIVAESSVLSPLQHMRRLITQMFLGYEENFTIFIENNPSKPLWSIRIFRPILTSPTGSPLLLLSAIDYRLADKLVANGQLQKKQFEKDVKRFFRQKGGIGTFKFPVDSEETADLIRYVFRLNSTKFVPPSWQKEENIPPGESSPFLATFISLLYLDFSYLRNENSDSGWAFLHSFDDLVPGFNPDRCTRCGIQPDRTLLKRCSKCKAVHYCSPKCQRLDWETHKLACSLILNC